jgi:hypothetical protein
MSPEVMQFQQLCNSQGKVAMRQYIELINIIPLAIAQFPFFKKLKDIEKIIAELPSLHFVFKLVKHIAIKIAELPRELQNCLGNVQNCLGNCTIA